MAFLARVLGVRMVNVDADVPAKRGILVGVVAVGPQKLRDVVSDE